MKCTRSASHRRLAGTSTALALMNTSVASANEISLSPIPPGDCKQPLHLSFFGDTFTTPNRFRSDLLQPTRPLLDWADANIVNFEGAVTAHPKRAFPEMPFALRIAPELPPLLAANGIRHATRANNHAMDFGVQGLKDTDAALKAAGIASTGTGLTLEEALKPLTLSTVPGAPKVAILSFSAVYPAGAWATSSTPGTPFASDAVVEATIRKVRETHDFVVPVFHWGHERTFALRPYQPILARLSLKAGAAAVVGHHAHVAQGTELRDERWIAYGLGNYIFTTVTDHDDLSLAMHVEFCHNKNPKVAFTPLETRGLPSHWAVRPHGLESFRRTVRPLATSGAMIAETPIFIPELNTTRTLKEWMTGDSLDAKKPKPARP